MRGLIIALLTFVSFTGAVAQVILRSDTRHAEVSNISYFHTTDTRLDITSVSHQAFTPLDSGRTVSLGFDKGIHWFRFDVVNPSLVAQWLVEIGYAPLDHVEFYAPDRDGNLSLQFAGDLYPISKRKIQSRHLVFPFTIGYNTRETLYIKVVTTSSVQLPVDLWTQESYRDHVYQQQFAHGIFYGMMLIMIFYNLFLYISIRDKTTLYYVLTLITGTNVIAFFQGYGFYYIYPEYPELNEFFSAFSSPMFIISSVALTRSFLQLKQFSFQLDRMLLAIAIVAFVASLLTIGLGDYVSYTPLHILALLDFAGILASAVYCFIRDYRPARYFLLAWVSMLIIGVFFSLRNIGVLHDNWFTNNALYFGGIMQTLLISFALGDRINLLRKENQEVKDRELLQQHDVKEKLEREVALRTEEIRMKNSQLEESNNIKDKLLSIVSHDLKGPLNSLKGTLNIVEMGSLTAEELPVVTKKIGEQLHLTADFLDNLLQWCRIQMKGEKFVPLPERFSVRDLLNNSTQLLKAESDAKGISLHVDLVADFEAYADLNMMQTVVRNLVSNALKFTHAGGRIELSASKKGKFVIVTVSDTGIGIADRYMDTLFTLQGVTLAGTKEEKGTGIGLVVCKEFVERNGGTITVTSTVGIGTTFELIIPAAETFLEL